ncbi:hypothetical protein RUM44_011574 [Polyplax serrata]|uniref:Voltage-dependent calcium channel alpha-2/delta subunit conserved region domain-containing protein n=1 Tax=Polyplax serrata TaxID=468196 RepID=A0ABR1AQE1_POLSC
MFGVTTSFVATRSGLLRWREHGNSPPDLSVPHFSETNKRAIDELWYKRAVHQHTIEPESFVFSVPFDADLQKRPLVTATHAVFVEHKGHRAPAAVVGLQFQHSTLASHFINITSACTGGMECRRNCASPELDCYVLDNNGFIILSESLEHTGKFFGQIDGTIMDSLVQDRIYKKVAVYDYQGACYDDKSPYSDSAPYASPLEPAKLFFRILLRHFKWLVTQTQFHYWLLPSWAEGFSYTADDEDDDDDDDDLDYTDDYESNNPFDAYGETDNQIPPIKEEDTDSSPEQILRNFNPPPEVVHPLNSNPSNIKYSSTNGSSPRPCDKRVFLYNLQPDRLNTSGIFNPLKGKLTNCHSSGCERPFSVQKIPHSNLILLVVDTLCPCGSKQLSITPQEVVWDGSSCRRKPQESMYRRRPPKCINYHPEEIEIHLCGKAYEMSASAILLSTCLAVIMTRLAGDFRWTT